MKNRVQNIVLLLLMVLPLSAQNEYRSLKLDAGILVGEANKHDIGLIAPYLEPKWNINNKFSVGLRLEYTFYRKEGFIDYTPDNPYKSDYDADGWNISTILTGDYYFNDHYVRPFVGTGAGLYYMNIEKENAFDLNKQHIIALGYMPRVGFNVGQIRFSFEYNFIFTNEVNLDYFTFKIGYEIGGGKKWF